MSRPALARGRGDRMSRQGRGDRMSRQGRGGRMSRQGRYPAGATT